MKLIFVRHGQTDFNLQGRPQGQEMDIPLNDTGRKQVENAAQYIPADIDFIISSPLKRAAETAAILNRTLGKEIIYNDDIKELKYGNLAGKLWTDIAVETGDKDIHVKDKALEFNYHQYGGESADDLAKRVVKFIEETKQQYPDKKILVTAHGGVIDTLQKLYTQDAKLDTQNAEVHEYTF